jgi:hypothetical protein
MWFHAGLLDITIGKETAWARSGPASAAAKLALTMCRSAFSKKSAFRNEHQERMNQSK